MHSNNFASNFTRPIAKVFLDAFESSRVLSKNVNTQLIKGKFSPDSGTVIDVKRPTDYKSNRTSDGDISALDKSPIITGKASATVQDYFTVAVEYDEVDEALKMNQLPELLAPMATRIVTDFETDFAQFMLENAGLSIGSPDTPVTTWAHVAEAGALMKSLGIPAGDWSYVMNPFVEATLANTVVSLGAGGVAGALVKTAHEQAVLKRQFAGFNNVMSAATLGTVTTNAISDRAGTLTADPDATYLTAKDTMKQTLAITAVTASLVVKAGEIVEITGRFQTNLNTKKTFVNAAGDQLKYRGVVTADATLAGSGAGNLIIAGPAIFESDGAYNTVDSALVSGDVITLLGTASTAYQPNLFFHKNAFGVGSVPLKKLFATDTIMTTADGLQLRVTRYSDGDANKQMVRFDFLPAYSVFNPFFAGQGHA